MAYVVSIVLISVMIDNHKATMEDREPLSPDRHPPSLLQRTTIVLHKAWPCGHSFCTTSICLL